MRKVNVLVCDDQPEVVEQTKELLLRYEDQFGHAMCILGVTSYDEAESFDADLLFLDIEMPGKSGLVIRDELEKKNADSLIIFVTSHSETVWEAFGRNVIGFFEKPMDYERLCKLMKTVRPCPSTRLPATSPSWFAQELLQTILHGWLLRR